MKRSVAQQANLHKYFADQPCKRGHIALRYTRNGVCTQCKYMYKSNTHKQTSMMYKIIEERVHIQDVAAVRDYCQRLRNYREGIENKPSCDNV